MREAEVEGEEVYVIYTHIFNMSLLFLFYIQTHIYTRHFTNLQESITYLMVISADVFKDLVKVSSITALHRNDIMVIICLDRSVKELSYSTGQ